MESFRVFTINPNTRQYFEDFSLQKSNYSALYQGAYKTLLIFPLYTLNCHSTDLTQKITFNTLIENNNNCLIEVAYTYNQYIFDVINYEKIYTIFNKHCLRVKESFNIKNFIKEEYKDE